MMVTICSKFGTREFGVAVSVEVGIAVSVTVGRIGTEVNVEEGTGVGIFVGGTGRGVQATNKTKRRIQKPERFMKISILSIAFGVL
jgi:hypothetical protein